MIFKGHPNHSLGKGAESVNDIKANCQHYPLIEPPTLAGSEYT